MIQVPMFHCFGMVLAMTAAMTHGTMMSPITAFSPRRPRLHQSGEDHRVPRRAHDVHRDARAPDFDKTDFSHMRTGIMAGSPCPVKVMQDVVDKMHMSEICITYGQTEAPRLHDEQDDRFDRTRASRRSAARCSASSARSLIPRRTRTCPITWTASLSPAATTS